MTSEMDPREALIRLALADVGSALSPDERDEISTFVDAGEYGVAVEAFCDLIREEKKKVPVAVILSLREVGRVMGMDPSTFDEIGEVLPR